MPAVTPVTIPEISTVAMPVAPELHTPLPAASLNVVIAPVQTDAVPVIVPALADELTVATVVALALPQPLVTV